MIIDSALLNQLSAQAKTSPRLRQAYDLRTTPEDNSQRILNAMEPGTVLPIHRHRGSTETVVVLRGKLRQKFYDENGQLTESFEVAAASNSTPSINSGTGSPQAVGFSVELDRWHNTECLESGTVILEGEGGRSFDKLRNLLSKVKYTRKKINAGTLEEWKKEQFLEVANMRDETHLTKNVVKKLPIVQRQNSYTYTPQAVGYLLANAEGLREKR